MSDFQNLLVRKFLHSFLFTVMTKSNLEMRSVWPSWLNWRTTKLNVLISNRSLKQLSNHWTKPVEILSMSIRMRRRRQTKSTSLTSLSIRGKWWMKWMTLAMNLRQIHNPRRSSTKFNEMRMKWRWNLLKRRWNLPLIRWLLETGLKTTIVKTGWLYRWGKLKGTPATNK